MAQRSLDTVRLLAQARATPQELKQSDPLPARDDDSVEGCEVDKRFYVYILASYTQRLYIGLTSDLEGRLWQHRTKATPGHTSKYNIDWLVHVEEFARADDAIARERQLKGWSRQKKIDLIVRGNPTWRDLAIELFDWSENEFRP